MMCECMSLGACVIKIQQREDKIVPKWNNSIAEAKVDLYRQI